MTPVALVDPEPLARPEPPALLAAEVDRLPPGSVLVAERGFRVLLVSPDDAPALLREIGVQRERTFRAAREGSGRERDLDRAERALGVRPEVISGVEEGRLSFDGARSQFTVDDPVLVSDIGGGSTELVIDDEVISVEMGSVRLTDRMSPAYPLPDRDRQEGLEMARSAFAGIDVAHVATHIGVAGTWTSLAAIAQGLPRYEPAKVHGYRFDNIVLGDLVDRLCDMSLEEIASIPSLDPKRAPVIRAGAMVAQAVAGLTGLDATLISVKDSLDGAALALLGLTLHRRPGGGMQTRGA